MKSLAAHPAEPLFAMDGGPGLGSAQDAAAYFDATLPKLILRRHDIVFVDQLGTGLSDPLNCDLFDAPKVVSYFSTLYPKEAVDRCASIVAKRRNLAQYGTVQAADDLDAVRRALGYKNVDLYGASYGTALAMVYMRRHELTTHLAFLDGVASPDSYLPLDFAVAAQHVLSVVIDQCYAEATCNRAFPELRADYNALLRRLDQAPILTAVADPVSKRSLHVVINRAMFAERLRYFLYDVSSQSAVPLFIHEMAHGNYDDFIHYGARLTAEFESGFSKGLYLTITCSEDVPFISDREIAIRTEDTLAGDSRVRMHQRACARWPRYRAGPDLTTPARIHVPTIMFTGLLDPSTPVSESSEALGQFSNARRFLIPNAAHVGVSRCEDGITIQFMETRDYRHLDGRCLQVLTRPSFVTERTDLAEALRSIP